jgi:hypothetical protein
MTHNEKVMEQVAALLNGKYGRETFEGHEDTLEVFVEGGGHMHPWVCVRMTDNWSFAVGTANEGLGVAWSSNCIGGKDGGIAEDSPENHHLEEQLNRLPSIPDDMPGILAQPLIPKLASVIAAILNMMALNTQQVINSLSTESRRDLRDGTYGLHQLVTIAFKSKPNPTVFEVDTDFLHHQEASLDQDVLGELAWFKKATLSKERELDVEALNEVGVTEYPRGEKE